MNYSKPSPADKRLRGDKFYNRVMSDIRQAIRREDVDEIVGLDEASVTTALIVAIGSSAPLRGQMEE